ncbi:UNVERIFIED_CONTAM: hypothetical protein GTU68_020298 [Idotea baltica]|nr:hypothetical protein [Idotea baltica]
MTTLFITGIDTDIGKSVACGALANTLLNLGVDVCTQKWVETGCEQVSQDLITHQAPIQRNLNPHDESLHSPYRFKFAASPHLAAKLENREIDTNYLQEQTQKLRAKSDHLLIEGAGGLCVPFNSNELLVDLVQSMNLPIVLVTSGRLGSINHTLLSLELCSHRNIEIRAIIYNQYPLQDETITNDTRNYLQNYLEDKNINTLWLELTENAQSMDLDRNQLEQLLSAS